MIRCQINRFLGWMALMVSVSVTAFPSPPSWLVNIAKVAAPVPQSAPAVVLLDETFVTIQKDGGKTTRHRCAIRIQNQSGRQFASGWVPYLEKVDDVSSTGAWVLRAGKEVSPKEDPKWTDLSAADDGAVFSEMRKLVVNYDDFALVGDVFGYETVVEGKLDFPQLRANWEATLPVLKSSYTLQLAPGWSMQSMVTGPLASQLLTSTEPQRWTWDFIDRPYRPDEPAMSDNARMDADLMITLTPPAQALRNILPVFRSWSDVADWLIPMQDTQCDTSPALIENTRQLTTGNADNLAKIRSLSRYVQSLRYISFDKGLIKGFGYRPRKASEAHLKGWGDCKAKANLLRAMLRIEGIESYMVQAHTTRGREIFEDWPSPMQFNHAILAIKVDDALDFPAVVTTPKWGRLLFFDATNPDVLLGDLPSNLQGGRVHVVAAGSDALTTLPVIPTETHHVSTRLVRLELDPSGAVKGECDYGGPGSVGAYYRAISRSHSAGDFRKYIAERLCVTVSGASIEDSTTRDDPVTGEFRIKYRFSAPHFGQMMPGGLAVVRLDVLSRDTVPAFPAKERKLPVELNAGLSKDEVTLTLPSGFVVDEIPEAAKLSSPYGCYESSYEVKGGAVIARRTLKMEDRIVPVGEYAALRKFLGDVSKAEHSSVVLRKGE